MEPLNPRISWIHVCHLGRLYKIFPIITLWFIAASRPKHFVPVTAFGGTISLRRTRTRVPPAAASSFSKTRVLADRARSYPLSKQQWNTDPSTMRHQPLQISLATASSIEDNEIINQLQSCLEELSEESLISDACQILEQASSIDYTTSTLSCFNRISFLSLDVANQLCQIGSDPSRKRKATWTDLQEFAQRLLPTTTTTTPTSAMAPSSIMTDQPSDARALAISLVFGILALTCRPGTKAAASALATTVSSGWTVEANSVVPGQILRAYLHHGITHMFAWNWNTLTQFARAFHLTDQAHPQLASLVSQVTELELERLSQIHSMEERKQLVSGILALACQVKPWSSGLRPLRLVEAAIPLDYWHAAELICQNARDAPQLTEAVEYLIDTAMDERTYRRADSLATNLYDIGGRSRFVQARFQHACDTISQVVYKRQLPIIERQVSRVDKALERVEQDPNVVTLGEEGERDASKEIRLFALMRLEEAGEHDAAHRLATLWELDYVFDSDAIKAATAARRQTYLQFDEVLKCPLPDVISDPDTLRKEFGKFWKCGPYPQGPFGMDAEWEEDAKGVDLLQLAHPQLALLIDVPMLVSSSEGRLALKETVGTLLDSSDTVVVGFACRQDLSRLRHNSSWLTGTRAVVDMQPLVVQNEPDLAAVSNRVGLARVCQHFFGKPLDKSEQCSFWGARPLSQGQRSYAALDAWVCAAAYETITQHRDTKEELNATALPTSSTSL